MGLLNVDGYYDPLLYFLRTMTSKGFLSEAQRDVLRTGKDPRELLDVLHAQARAAQAPDDYSRI